MAKQKNMMQASEGVRDRASSVRPVVVVSKCLEFDSCRWNGMMISSPAVARLKPLVDFIPVCPEVEIGLGVPRKPIRLVRMDDGTHLLQAETGRDIGTEMKNFVDRFLDSLGEVDGFLLKDRSPSCGNKDVKLYAVTGKASPLAGNASGFFGGPVSERFPHLAVENEGRLNSFTLREHFYTRLFALARFRRARHAGTAAELVRYHTENKFILLMYNQKAMREMGRAVANLEKRPVHEAYRLYEGLLHHALSRVPRFASAVNVLMHAEGYFAKELSAREKAYFLDTLEQFRAGRAPLSVCSAIVKSWIARFGEKYLDAQTFFNPYPESLIDITDSGKGRGL